MHEHPEKKCAHTLKFCEHCDVVFCQKCKREWKEPPTTTWTYPWTWYTSGQAQQDHYKQFTTGQWGLAGQVLCSHQGE